MNNQEKDRKDLFQCSECLSQVLSTDLFIVSRLMARERKWPRTYECADKGNFKHSFFQKFLWNLHELILTIDEWVVSNQINLDAVMYVHLHVVSLFISTLKTILKKHLFKAVSKLYGDCVVLFGDTAQHNFVLSFILTEFYQEGISIKFSLVWHIHHIIWHNFLKDYSQHRTTWSCATPSC